MKLINKEDLLFTDGYLTTRDGTVITACNKLAHEFNELMRVSELNDFVKEYKNEIIASTGKVVFSPKKEPVPAFEYDPEIQTPFRDAVMAEAEELALEFLAVSGAKDVVNSLACYRELARWFDERHILQPEHNEVAPIKFSGNILELTKDEVVDIVATMHDPEIASLMDKIVIDFQ